ncbi:MAG: amidohydrolase [Bacteroidales bacterium]|jgi:predicted amidohydrolase|nr:amidohydrolase [Bacteroidales bacterium]
MKVTLVQYSPKWEDAPFNLNRVGGMLQALSGATDMIVLPEMWATGFSMNVAHISAFAEDILSWMRQLAANTSALVTGSVAVRDGSRYFNRQYWVMPDGDVGHYDKRHLFSMSDEPQFFHAGEQSCRFVWQGWNIRPVICYDLRFPAWCRNTKTQPYDLLLCSASWPSVRSDVWSSLLKARALENQCFVVGVNRVGADGNGLQHSGGSVIYAPKGETIGKIAENEETTATFELSLENLQHFRTKFAVLNDMDSFSFTS